MKFKKYFVVILAVLVALSVFVEPSWHRDFANWGWWCFIAVMLVRPVFEVWNILIGKFAVKLQEHKLVNDVVGLVRKVLVIAMGWRRELGILAGVFGLAHGVGVIWNYKSLADIFTPEMWDFSTKWGWGMLAAVLLLPLVVTSNVWSMKALKGLWKPLQRLAYVAFVASGMHIFFVENEAGPLVIVGLWLVLWVAVWVDKRKKIRQVQQNQ